MTGIASALLLLALTSRGGAFHATVRPVPTKSTPKLLKATISSQEYPSLFGSEIFTAVSRGPVSPLEPICDILPEMVSSVPPRRAPVENPARRLFPGVVGTSSQAVPIQEMAVPNSGKAPLIEPLGAFDAQPVPVAGIQSGDLGNYRQDTFSRFQRQSQPVHFYNDSIEASTSEAVTMPVRDQQYAPQAKMNQPVDLNLDTPVDSNTMPVSAPISPPRTSSMYQHTQYLDESFAMYQEAMDAATFVDDVNNPAWVEQYTTQANMNHHEDLNMDAPFDPSVNPILSAAPIAPPQFSEPEDTAAMVDDVNNPAWMRQPTARTSMNKPVDLDMGTHVDPTVNPLSAAPITPPTEFPEPQDTLTMVDDVNNPAWVRQPSTRRNMNQPVDLNLGANFDPTSNPMDASLNSPPPYPETHNAAFVAVVEDVNNPAWVQKPAARRNMNQPVDLDIGAPVDPLAGISGF